MAFLSKVGKIFRQSSSASRIGSDLLQPSKLSIFQTIRCMSSTRIFVGGLSYGTDNESLKEAFSKYGEVIEARVIMDRETGRSRGFGFVAFAVNEDASSAIEALNGTDLQGRKIRVNYADEKPPHPSFSGGGYNSGGSYNNRMSRGDGGDRNQDDFFVGGKHEDDDNEDFAKRA